MTIVANEKNNRFKPEGCGRKGPSRFSSASYTSSTSGKLGPVECQSSELFAYHSSAYLLALMGAHCVHKANQPCLYWDCEGYSQSRRVCDIAPKAQHVWVRGEVDLATAY
jgi:hypothetical protein